MRILVVDDNRFTLSLLEKCLTHEGYGVVTCEDPEEGLRRAVMEEYDLLVFDLMMPRLSGFDLIRELRSKRTEDYTPILILTARDDLQARLDGLEAGADDLLVKPFEIEELLLRVRTLLRIKRLQVRLKKAQGQSVETAKLVAKGKMAADLAHELNNPLAVIRTSSQVLGAMLSGGDAEPLGELKKVTSAVDRMATLIRKLLWFHSPEGEPSEHCSVNEVIGQLLSTIVPQMKRDSIETVVELDPELPLLWCVREHLKQVLASLVTNAHQAIGNGGTIRVATGCEEGRIFIKVTDDGEGISRDRQDKIFDPFYSTKAVKGAGLGLSASYGIVRKYGGEITVDSRQGLGASFTVWLPLPEQGALEGSSG